jgi:tRNA(adenine34) deaminase
MDQTSLMREALEEAEAALVHGDVPVGALVVAPDGVVIARDHNRREERADPTAHAELLAIRSAAERQGTWRLDGHTLVVTLEPCVMCAGAAVAARLAHIVYGAADLKGGGCWSLYNIPQDRRLNHNLTLEAGVLADDAAGLLTRFFESRR